MMNPAAPQTTRGERGTRPPFDVARIRRDFPILDQRINGKPLVYLDNAATSQKPRAVIDALRRYYEEDNSNVHRGIHALSVRATEAYERARRGVQKLLNASRPEEIIFVRGTTEAINLVAQTYGRTHVRAGDEVLISAMEHHSNIVPWQILCEQTGGRLRVVPMNDAGELMMEEFEKLLGPRTRLVAIAHVSNALGTVNPLRQIIDSAHRHGVPVLVDGAQAVPHMAVDVRALDCDFYAFSGHKCFGPTGIGALYGKFELLDALPPYHGGGDMISSVSFEKTTYNTLPYRFEAGTPNVEGVIGLGAAIEYMQSLRADAMAAHEQDLLEYATASLAAIPQVRLIGTARDKVSVVSFVVDDIHAHDVATLLDAEGVAIRSGHHCAQPVMQRFGLPATCRASLAFYNTREDIDALVAGLHRVVEVFAP